MSKIAGEINAEMMHPKVIHEQRKALFAEMVRKTGSQQSVLDRLLQEIKFLRDHEGGPMDEEVIDILRGKVAELEAENTLHKSAMDNLAAKLTEAERQRDERVTGFNLTVAAVESAERIKQLEAERDELLADAMRYRAIKQWHKAYRLGGIAGGMNIHLLTSTRWPEQLDAAIDEAIAKLKGRS